MIFAIICGIIYLIGFIIISYYIGVKIWHLEKKLLKKIQRWLK